jgi:CubicO group peptidase (beta-lactamase class C family)
MKDATLRLKKSAIEILCERAVEDRVFPGCGFAVGIEDHFWTGGVGRLSWAGGSELASAETIYDLASLTKVLDTTVRVHQACASGVLSLGTSVADILPAFGGEGRNSVTIEDLLRHRSGLPAHVEYWKMGIPPPGAMAKVLSEPFVYAPRSKSIYSCVGFIVLMEVLRTLKLVPDASKYVHPWGLGFSLGPVRQAAPTEGVRGIVHDENCRFFGGFAGNAGLFGSAITVGKFAKLFLQQMEDWRDWITLDDGLSTRARGWDTKSESGSSAGSLFGPNSFGHTGFTGTSLWFDPDRKIFAALLSNRVHPSRTNTNLLDFRPVFADAASEFLASNGY